MCLGVPAEVVDIADPATPRAKVALGGVERIVATDLLIDDDLRVGDWVLVHVGFALAKIDAAEAADTIAAIRRLGSYDDEVASFATSSAT